MPTDESTPFPKVLIALLALRLCLPLSAIFVLLFAQEPLRTTLFQIAIGAFFVAGILLVFTVHRRLDWGSTSLVLLNIVFLLLTVVPTVTNSMYTYGLAFALFLISWTAPWIARRLKRSRGEHGSSGAEVN